MAMASSSVLPSSTSPQLPPRLVAASNPNRLPTPCRKFPHSSWRDHPSTLRCRIQDQELLCRPVCRRFFPQMATADPTVASGDLSSKDDDNIENEGHDMEPLREKPTVDDGVEDEADAEASTDQQMVRVCEKLIDVFMVDKPHTTDWRRLLAFSKEWVNIRAYFYKRCQERAEAEVEPSMRHALFRLGRKLKEVDEDVQRHNELLDAVKKASPDIGGLIARRRKDFTREFFEHLHAVAESYCDSPMKQKALVELQSICLAALEAHDSASESVAALDAAALKFENIINSPTLDDACRKIDDLAEKKQLDSALMLLLTKAWSAAKDSNLTKNEAKDILYHLYMTAMKNLETQLPKETRILRHLLTIEDPEELTSTLNDAFTPPGPGEYNPDSLYTTPDVLFAWIQSVLNAYNFRTQDTLLLGEAKDFMNPRIIPRLEELKRVIKDRFM